MENKRLGLEGEKRKTKQAVANFRKIWQMRPHCTLSVVGKKSILWPVETTNTHLQRYLCLALHQWKIPGDRQVALPNTVREKFYNTEAESTTLLRKFS